MGKYHLVNTERECNSGYICLICIFYFYQIYYNKYNLLMKETILIEVFTPVYYRSGHRHLPILAR